MAGKISSKKLAGKPKTPVVPAVVLTLRAVATSLQNVPNVPDDLKDARIKVIVSIGRLADRVAKNLANVGKVAERVKAKETREAAKKVRTAAKRVNAEKKIAALKAKLADAEKALES